ncbi:MAG: phosphoribosylamine--glycine ligase, partial [Chitinivibrionales bacterium]|nr:phosphoribosylamine--glycine ligase [Chitinivibrionales bacterium]MBD3396416.1 phosphoribosylamine--glycine ligase [Chitinivibrionales bacterium]
GSTVVLEEKMTGEEASVFVLTDGKDYRVLPVSQDHKPAFDGDTGPNTGGMGAYAPAPVVDRAMLTRIEDTIVKPTLDAMAEEGSPYRGLLYIGVMLTPDGPKVVEYNCRFGDPETQAVLPLVHGDWFELLSACATGRLSKVAWTVRDGACVTVVLASGGYPGEYEKGKLISGLDDAEHGSGDVDVYHAGTKKNAQGKLATNGGRVLAVSAWGDTLHDAVATAYEFVAKIHFEGKQFRKDIAAKGLKRLTRVRA